MSGLVMSGSRITNDNPSYAGFIIIFKLQY